MTAQSNILIVDDTPANLHLLVGLLKEQGYKVRPAPSGKHALSVARGETIDLILLDILMPEMDGYEVCRRFKAQEATREIPIIFLSALQETFDKVKAFEVGGVDYISKPFQAEEVLARVKTQLDVRHMQQQLQLQNIALREQRAQLHQEIAERRRVEEALRESNASKDTFFSIIAHDLRSPFTALLGNADLAMNSFDTSSQEKLKDHITEMKTSAESVYALLGNLLTWSRIQRGVMDSQPCSLPLDTEISEICRLFRPHANHKQIVLCRQIPETLMIYADEDMFCTVIRNLLSNALKFTHVGGRIDISARGRDRAVEISISDSGVGIPEDRFSDLFRLDVKTTSRGTNDEPGTGLGLPLCKDLVEQNDGTIRINSILGQGTTFIVTLPGSHTPLQTPQHTSEDVPTIDTEEYGRPSKRPQMPETTAPINKETLAAALCELPKARQAELRHAVTIADVQAIEALVEQQIRRQNESLADAVNTLVQRYEYNTILNALESLDA